jgi:hypothetical protein
MATQYSTLLKLALPTQGELSGSWGDVVNNNITSMIEEAVAGLKTIDTWSTNSATLSTADGTTAEARAAILNLTDTTSDLSGAATLICPALSKVYIVKNATGQAVTVKTASGSGVAIPNGTTGFVFCDGTNVVESLNNVTGNLTVGGNASIGGNLVVTGTTTFNGGTLTLGDANTDNIVFGGEVDSNIIPDDDDSFDLGSSSKQWRNLYVDGTAYIDTLDLNGTAIASTAAELNIVDGGTAASSVTIADADRLILNDDGTMKQIAVTSLAAYLDDEITAMPNLTSVGTLGTLTVDNIIINGTTIGHTSDTDAMSIASNGNVTVSQNLTVTGDLTISGDDLVMGTNTAGHILVADGTNFNPTAVGDLSEISTVANDDVFLAVDTSGGGLKKITRSAVVAGLATSSAISNVSEDSTPQLGGNLDLNGNDIVTTSNADLELAPNGTGHVTIRGNTNQGTIQFNCENNSHGQQVKAAPHSESASNVLTLPSTGGDARLVSATSTATLTNKTLTNPVITNMTGSTITLDSAGDINIDADGGDIFFKDGGTTFGSATNTSGNLILKSGTTTALTFDGANVAVAGNLSVAGTTTTVNTVTMEAANAVVFEGATADANETTLTITDPSADRTIKLPNQSGTIPVLAADSDTAITSTPAELNILDGVTSTAAEINILDGVTSTTAELNILDGVTSTAAELNIMDGDTSASSTTLVDADRVVTNDNGTMKQVSLSDVKTYLSSAGFSQEDPTALAIALG